MKVKASSEVGTALRTSRMTAAELKEWIPWIEGLPDDAKIDATMRELGSQRDPYSVLAGLKATWEEER